jgi:hypothetical protein
MSVVLEPEAARLYQQMLPMAGDDEANGYAMAHLCAVLMAPVELVTQLASDNGDLPGWRNAVDVDEAPAQLLPWLGQFNGTPLQDGEPEEEQRRKIREARGSHRGTTRAVISDLKATLTGTQSVVLIERDGDPFQNLFVVLPAEMPDEALAVGALTNRQTKPLGVINTVVSVESPIIDEGTKTIDEATGVIDTAKLSDVT